MAAPSRALLERALQQRESGVTLATTRQVPRPAGPDGQVNVSALVYQNLAPALEAGGRQAARQRRRSASGPARRRWPASWSAHGPTLVYAYGEEDRILFASSNQSPLGPEPRRRWPASAACSG